MAYKKGDKISMERNRQYQRKWYLANRAVQTKRSYERSKLLRPLLRKWIRELKQQSVCADCGYSNSKYPEVLEFDHVKGGKKFNISQGASSALSLETIKKEIEKCEIVCANCHRIRTFKRRKTRERDRK